MATKRISIQQQFLYLNVADVLKSGAISYHGLRIVIREQLRLIRNSNDDSDEKFKRTIPTFSTNWWNIVNVRYQINQPQVRARLERLMENNLVRMSNRKYMQELQQRIRDDYIHQMDKRIKSRMAREMEREKRLILNGQIPFSEAPESLWMHPVLVIDRYTNRLTANRRDQSHGLKLKLPECEFLDPTPDPPTDLTIGNGHMFNPDNNSMICGVHDDIPISDEIQNHYMFTDEDYYKLFYINPLVLEMNDVDTIDELYDKAEEVLGPLKNLTVPS